jgi:hypothetical protein
LDVGGLCLDIITDNNTLQRNDFLASPTQDEASRSFQLLHQLTQKGPELSQSEPVEVLLDTIGSHEMRYSPELEGYFKEFVTGAIEAIVNCCDMDQRNECNFSEPTVAPVMGDMAVKYTKQLTLYQVLHVFSLPKMSILDTG